MKEDILVWPHTVTRKFVVKSGYKVKSGKRMEGIVNRPSSSHCVSSSVME